MSLKLLILLISISYLSLEANSTPMNNIGYLARGYNIFKGNPLAHGVDPGFTKTLFDFKYDGRVTADQRYDIPIGADIEKQSTCNLNFATEELTTERSYYNKLSAYASVEGGFLGASFSASADYKKIKDEKATSNYVYTITTGECIVYKAIIDDYYPPVLDANFKKTIMERLPEAYDNDEYFKFVNSYGTHFVSEVLMGSRMSVINSLKEKDRTELISRGVDIKASAGYSGLATIKVSGGVDKESKNTELFKSKIQKTEIHCIGSDPPKDGDANSWANQVVREPMPVKYVLMPIYELIDMENLYLTEADSRVKKVQDNVRKALDQYCTNLKKQDPSLTCNSPPIEKQQAMKFKNNCALCARKCGGDYSVESGIMALNMKGNSGSFQTYGPYCDGGYGSNNVDKDGAKLCCMPETPQKYGSCKFCSTCGGDFDKESGKIAMGLDIDGWTGAAGDKCLENIRGRARSKDGFNLCCTQHDICSLCTKCGGSFPHETGVLGIKEANIFKYTSKGDFCSGAFKQGRPYTDGIRLCCSTPAAILA